MLDELSESYFVPLQSVRVKTKMLFNQREQWYILQDLKISSNKHTLKVAVSFFVICLLVAYPWCKKLTVELVCDVKQSSQLNRI